MVILKVTALRYAIVQRIEQISGNALQIRQGSLYPALYRLENRGWLDAEWRTTEGGREAKFYRLTKAGQKQLEEKQSGWKRLCDAISLVMEATD